MSDNPIYLLIKHRRILLQATRNDIAERYAGSFVGIGWSILVPLLLLAVYAVTYLYIFRVRLPDMSTTAYVVYIFAGLVPFLSISETISLGVPSIVANKATLNSTVFPIDLAPAKGVLISQITMAVGMVITIIGATIAGTLSWTIVFLPIIWVLQIIALLGLNWLLSLLNVVFRDLQNIISPILMILLIASPIAYTPTMIPPKLAIIITLNPAAYFIKAYQYLIVFGKLPSPLNIVAIVVIAFVLLALGNWFFGRVKRIIADYV